MFGVEINHLTPHEPLSLKTQFVNTTSLTFERQFSPHNDIYPLIRDLVCERYCTPVYQSTPDQSPIDSCLHLKLLSHTFVAYDFL